MDVFAALADNLGDVKAHLPLNVGMGNVEVFYLINLIYLSASPQDANSYVDTQVFLDRDGKARFEVIEQKTGNVLFTFVNLAQAQATSSPALSEDGSPYLGDVITLTTEETKLFKGLYTGQTYPIDRPGIDDFPFQLAQFLNDKGFVGGWNSGTFGALCTAGLEVVFKGNGADIPEGFPASSSNFVVILKMNHGTQKGYVCLVA